MDDIAVVARATGEEAEEVAAEIRQAADQPAASRTRRKGRSTGGQPSSPWKAYRVVSDEIRRIRRGSTADVWRTRRDRAEAPSLQVGEDTVCPGEQDMRGHGADVGIVIDVRCAGTARPTLGPGGRLRRGVGLDEGVRPRGGEVLDCGQSPPGGRCRHIFRPRRRASRLAQVPSSRQRR